MTDKSIQGTQSLQTKEKHFWDWDLFVQEMLEYYRDRYSKCIFFLTIRYIICEIRSYFLLVCSFFSVTTLWLFLRRNSNLVFLTKFHWPSALTHLWWVLTYLSILICLVWCTFSHIVLHHILKFTVLHTCAWLFSSSSSFSYSSSVIIFKSSSLDRPSCLVKITRNV